MLIYVKLDQFRELLKTCQKLINKKDIKELKSHKIFISYMYDYVTQLMKEQKEISKKNKQQLEQSEEDYLNILSEIDNEKIKKII